MGLTALLEVLENAAIKLIDLLVASISMNGPAFSQRIPRCRTSRSAASSSPVAAGPSLRGTAERCRCAEPVHCGTCRVRLRSRSRIQQSQWATFVEPAFQLLRRQLGRRFPDGVDPSTPKLMISFLILTSIRLNGW